MYGNYFDNAEDTITCMLLPKLMSINNPNFHFTSCNFTEKNMYIMYVFLLSLLLLLLSLLLFFLFCPTIEKSSNTI